MTIPSLVEKYQKKVFATNVEKTYNIVSNALISSIQENGAPNTWNFGAQVDMNGSDRENSSEHIEQMVEKYFMPYLMIVSSKKISSGYCVILANGTTLTFETDGRVNNNNIYTPSALYITASFKGKTSSYASLDRDYSRDDIIMVVMASTTDASKLKFFQWSGTGDSREKIKNHSTYGCNKNIRANRRFNCGALIQYDSWEVKDDYPW